MKLLVSVRSGAEVEPALTGGADIIDAKEPARGSLGPVSDAVLAEIMVQVPGDWALSIALGDFSDPAEVLATLSSLRLAPRPAPLYLKLGFAGVSASDRIEAMVAAAVAASESLEASPRIVIVAYADSRRAETASSDSLRSIAAAGGAAGVLLDTCIKDGHGLLEWIDGPSLERWVGLARAAGLVTALAGGLQLDDIAVISSAYPDVVGVRGAACDGGREGPVSAERVRALRKRTELIAAPFNAAVSLADAIGGETRDSGAISPWGEGC